MVFDPYCSNDNLNTVRAPIPNIQIPNPFKNQMFQGSDFEWFGIRAIGTIHSFGPNHSKSKLQYGRISLDRFIHEKIYNQNDLGKP